MNIGICDDEASVRSLLSRYIKSNDRTDKVYHFERPTDVKSHLKDNKPLEVLFLDIDLNDIQDGMALANELKKSAIDEGLGSMSLPLIIFVTGYPERMPEAFSVRAFHFLTKPVNEKVFKDILKQARKAVDAVRSGDRDRVLMLSRGGVTFSIRISDVYYVESFGRKIIFHTENGDIEIYGRLSDLADEMNGSFCRIHRSYVVNMNCIFDYSRQEITLTNGDKVPISKYRYDDFARAYAAFLGRQAL